MSHGGGLYVAEVAGVSVVVGGSAVGGGVGVEVAAHAAAAAAQVPRRVDVEAVQARAQALDLEGRAGEEGGDGEGGEEEAGTLPEMVTGPAGSAWARTTRPWTGPLPPVVPPKLRITAIAFVGPAHKYPLQPWGKRK